MRCGDLRGARERRPPDGRRRARGLSAIELLVVLAIASLALTLAAVAWRSVRGRVDVTVTARLVKSTITRARMLAVYRGADHFVVLDPGQRTIAIYRDSSLPKGALDPGDERVAREILPQVGELRLPVDSPNLPDPLARRPLTAAWSLPERDSAGAWDAGTQGLVATSDGRLVGADKARQPILSGVMVFSDREGGAAAVGVRGPTGSVRAFRLARLTWEEL